MTPNIISDKLTRVYVSTDADFPGIGKSAFDKNGAGYVLLKGVASTAVGDLVTFNVTTGVTARAAANAQGPCAVALVANVTATNYCWYQTSGLATITAGTVAADKPLYLTATPGSVDDAVVSGDLIATAFSVTATSGGFITARITNPYVTDTLS